jgi:UDP-N-acetylmuramate dehydrogenase
MLIHKNYPLKGYNTFGIEAYAAYFVVINTLQELQELLSLEEFRQISKLILGGGSNILFTRNFNGLVIKNELKGIQIIAEDDSHAVVRSGAGVTWHDFVLFCIERGLGGVENLSLIPGTVGAAPMQNIGAYGAEIKDVFQCLDAVSITDGSVHSFDNLSCKFGYRESIFKTEVKDKFIITSVTFRLSKEPMFNTSYGAISETLEQMGVKELSLKAVSDAVIAIRRSKLPDPVEIGNAGSFFKNPEIEVSQYQKLKQEYEQIPGYKINESRVKVPAGWLIEQCGWKGKQFGKVGVHKNQALVLVNYGGGTGEEIKKLAGKIQQSVKQKFGIELSPEVNFI